MGFKKIAGFLICFLFFSLSAEAQFGFGYFPTPTPASGGGSFGQSSTGTTLKIIPNGADYKFNIAPTSQASKKEFFAVFTIDGKSSGAFKLYAEPVKGAKVEIFASDIVPEDKVIKNNSLELSKFSRLPLMAVGGKKQVVAYTFGTSSGAINNTVTINGFTFELPDNSTNSSLNSVNRQQINFVVPKDACAKRSTTVVVKFSFDNFSTAELQKLGSYSFSVKNSSYKGKRRASIKPDSDGKYRGSPLILMESGGFWVGTPKIRLVKYKNQKPKFLNIAPTNYLFYRGVKLVRAPIRKGILSGGRGTFEISVIQGYEPVAYGVCFHLQRYRQRVNGYPS